MNHATPVTGQVEQRRRVRRSALLFGAVALGFYLLFIVYAVTHGHR
jgi:hypothetical protein